MPVSEDLLKRQFRILVVAALKGERCPQRKPFGPLESSAMEEMYRLGMIRGEVFGSNFRRITILVGPYAGRSTASFPGRELPYRVIGKVPMRQARRARPVGSIETFAGEEGKH